MKIQELHLKNFRGFEHRSFKFHDRLTLVVGENGSGKTCLLEGLSVALGGWICGFDGLESQDRRNIIKADRRAIIANANNALLEQIPMDVMCVAMMQSGESLQWSRGLTSLNGRTTTGGLCQVRRLSETFSKKIHSGFDSNIVLPVVAYYSAARLWNEPIQRERSIKRDKIRLAGYRRALAFSNSIKDTMSYIDRLSYLAYGDGDQGSLAKMKAVTNAIKTSLESVEPDVDVFYDRKLAEFCVRKSNGEVKPYSLLSDGYRGVTGLIIDICRRIMMLNPQLGELAIKETGGVVLIDEIDLHLHPRWQQKVLSDLLRVFPKLQFIATTHAPSVIQSARSENLMILNRESVNYPSRDVYGRDVNSILTDIMDAKVRPEAVEQRFQSIYDHISAGNISSATHELSELEQIVGENDAELSGIRVTIDLETLGV